MQLAHLVPGDSAGEAACEDVGGSDAADGAAEERKRGGADKRQLRLDPHLIQNETYAIPK